jgi:hypothetical protein
MNGTYAYSLSLSNGLDADAWRKMILEISFIYTGTPKPVYNSFFALAKDKDYFVLIRNHAVRKRSTMKDPYSLCWNSRKICVFH